MKERSEMGISTDRVMCDTEALLKQAPTAA